MWEAGASVCALAGRVGRNPSVTSTSRRILVVGPAAVWGLASGRPAGVGSRSRIHICQRTCGASSWFRIMTVMGSNNRAWTTTTTRRRREDCLLRQGRKSLSAAYRRARQARERRETERDRQLRQTTTGGSGRCCSLDTSAWSAVRATGKLLVAAILNALLEAAAARLVQHVGQ